MISGPGERSQDIYLSNAHRHEGTSKKHCHAGPKHYPTAAQFSLVHHTLKTKNSNAPDIQILNVLGKARKKPRGGPSPLLNVKKEGDAQPQWGKMMADHMLHSPPPPKTDTHSTLTVCS